MATNDYSCATFHRLYQNAFYFIVDEADAAGNTLEEDTLCKSDCHQFWIKSKDNKFLLLKDDGQFSAQNLTTHQQRLCGGKFNIQIYNNIQQGPTRGRAVILYVVQEGKKVVVCCSGDHKICSEEMELPSQIENTAHKAVFYLTRLATPNTYMLESSLFRTQFLALDSKQAGLEILVLHDRGEDEVDESCHFRLLP